MNSDSSNISFDKIVKHWIETSDDDFNTMLSLYNSKSFGWALFLGHISIEKLLKAHFVILRTWIKQML
jgi:HEPN domain-containing protein